MGWYSMNVQPETIAEDKIQKADIYSFTGTVVDSEVQPIVIPPASVLPFVSCIPFYVKTKRLSIFQFSIRKTINELSQEKKYLSYRHKVAQDNIHAMNFLTCLVLLQVSRRNPQLLYQLCQTNLILRTLDFYLMGNTIEKLLRHSSL